VSDWLQRVIDNASDDCGNCGVPRQLIGTEIEQCQNCGDDAFDIFAAAAAAQEVP
jgi:hypothetical protein